MGVMECNRSGCENIMCDRYSQRYGYICGECFEELCSMGDDASVAQFMGTPKRDAKDPKAAFARFDAVFPVLDYGNH